MIRIQEVQNMWIRWIRIRIRIRNTAKKRVRPVLRAGGGAGQDEGDHAAVRHHEDRVSHWQRGPRTVGFSFSSVHCWIHCCGSGLFISFILDLGSRIHNTGSKRGGENIYCFSYLFSYKFHKIENYGILFLNSTGKIWANWHRIKVLFPRKNFWGYRK